MASNRRGLRGSSARNIGTFDFVRMSQLAIVDALDGPREISNRGSGQSRNTVRIYDVTSIPYRTTYKKWCVAQWSLSAY